MRRKRNESARQRRTALYKSDHHHHLSLFACSIQCWGGSAVLVRARLREASSSPAELGQPESWTRILQGFFSWTSLSFDSAFFHFVLLLAHPLMSLVWTARPAELGQSESWTRIQQGCFSLLSLQPSTIKFPWLNLPFDSSSFFHFVFFLVHPLVSLVWTRELVTNIDEEFADRALKIWVSTC